MSSARDAINDPSWKTVDEDSLLKFHFHEPDKFEEALQVRQLHISLTKRVLQSSDSPLSNTMKKSPAGSASVPAAATTDTVAKKQRRDTHSVTESLSVGSRESASISSASRTIHQKKPKATVAHGSLLHQSCRLFSQTPSVIQSSVDMEPHQACQRAPKAPTGSSYLVGDGREPYSLPINILLNHKASLESLLTMARAAPGALILQDGRDDGCSVIIALRLYGKHIEKKDNGKSIPEALLEVNAEAAQVHDKRRNFPLHVASYVGASFEMINNLYWAYPEALLEKNFHGETPLDIAIRNGRCEDQVTNFLQEKINHLKTARLQRARLS